MGFVVYGNIPCEAPHPQAPIGSHLRNTSGPRRCPSVCCTLVRHGLSPTTRPGVLPVTLCPHDHTPPGRAALYRRLVDAGELPAGHGLDEDAAGVLLGGELVSVLRDRGDAGVPAVPADDELVVTVSRSPATTRPLSVSGAVSSTVSYGVPGPYVGHSRGVLVTHGAMSTTSTTRPCSAKTAVSGTGTVYIQ